MVSDAYQVRISRDTNCLQKKIYISRITYTRCQRPGTTNHPHHRRNRCDVFSPTTTAPHEDIVNQYIIPPPSFWLLICIRVMVVDFCLFAPGVDAYVCCWLFFHLGLLLIFFLHILVFTPFFFLIWWPTDLRAGPAKKRTMFPKALAPPLLRVGTWKLEALSLTQRCTREKKKREKFYGFFFRLDLAEISAKTRMHQLFNDIN